MIINKSVELTAEMLSMIQDKFYSGDFIECEYSHSDCMSHYEYCIIQIIDDSCIRYFKCVYPMDEGCDFEDVDVYEVKPRVVTKTIWEDI